MANINTPAHDFAPPWLKIPSYDNTARPSGADVDRGGHSSRKEGHNSGFSRPAKESDHYVVSRHQLSDNRREKNAVSGERKPSYLSSYHHSLDFDDSQLEGNSSSHNTNGDHSINGTSSSSQSALLRRPHSRHDFRNIPSSYIKGESFNRPVTTSTNLYYGNKGKILDSNSSSNNRGISVGSNNFNQEFPSLQGDDISEEPATTPPTVNGGVWEKPRNMKIHSGGIGKRIQLIKKPVASENIAECSRKHSSLPSSSSSSSALSSSGAASSTCNSHTVIVTPVAKGGPGIYRALIPAKSTTAKKSSLLKDGSKLAPPKKPPSSTPPPSTHSMEILVKHPKAPGNKSEFLKTLRNESKNTSHIEEDSQRKSEFAKEHVPVKDEAEEPHQNGIDIASLSLDNESEKGLSSSLEAERRLLREMGWKEEVSDDDNYAPLTEDEMREFRALSEQIAKKNGFRRSLQTNLSPKRLAPFSHVPLPTESDSSSSESDSDF